MGMLESLFNFSTDQSLSGTGGNSTNTYNAGVARKIFSGFQKKLKMILNISASGGTSPTIRARLVGADDAALTSNVVDICDTGVIAWTSGATGFREFIIGPQTVAKQHYGIIYVLTGTTPTFTVDAELADAWQENLNP